ncbi:FAD3E-like protein [Mya arenaria]|uniref:FAD3E-like protein n=1 Tax=Mya arenaria TaxID=6604 RepID=A0ABY7G2F1_MYAAR|nr:uncharacterized protein LOC128218761 [Mya arenaria]WAR27308.1 FAD3E-like protein [Mya arenaria]
METGQESDNRVKGSTHTANKNIQYPPIIQIKAAIPSSLFESNLLISLYFVFTDFLIISVLYVGLRLTEWLFPVYVQIAILPLYWYIQGTMLMALFVLGHDCGHGSFSRHEIINDSVGTVLHTLILTPYFSWKVSHRNHHKNTGNIDKDEVFYPVRKENENGNDFAFLFGLGLGWFVYLWRGYHPRKICHFNPLEAMFRHHVTGCTLSIMAMLAWVYCLYLYACSRGFIALLVYYVVPVIVFASWLLVVTFLHHIEENTPWYSEGSWTYVKGQVSSVDRNYGWAHHIIHNIGTHQVHHLFPRIPHYNLEAATCHFRAAFPQLVRKCEDPILPAMFRMYTKFSQQFRIANDVDIHVYR